MTDIGKAILNQMPTSEKDFICDDCKNYRGKLVCAANIFISTSMANTRGCPRYMPHDTESLKKIIKELEK